MNFKILLSALVLFFSASSLFSQEPVVKTAVYFRETPPLRDMKKIEPGVRDRSWKDNIIRNEMNEREVPGEGPGWTDPVLQTGQQGRSTTSYTGVNFEGLGNLNGVLPPDTEGDVGPDHYFQMINLSFAIYDKAGNLLHGPYDNSTLWDGFIGPWTGTNDGDPIVLYDELADRWMASQFAVNTSDGTYWQLIAVSATGDPAGAYYQYAFQFPDFNDYPKFGVWPDGYYASFNMFGSFVRVAAAVFERDSLLAGAPGARMTLFDLPSGSDPWSMMPSDFDGTPPPAGTPNFFACFIDSNPDELRIWEFSTDWSNPANSDFSQAQVLYPSPFDSDICNYQREQCIDQPGTNIKLEAISDRLMYRLQYRDFGTHEAMVVNHTVDAGGGLAGIRWYELRDEGSGWSIFQEGTYAPDSDHRWMGSIAMDSEGNIALGYSVSGSGTYPSIRYTGRMTGDPPGQMTLAETEIIAGAGVQTSTSKRWGDYSCMSVDPSDDLTFWYTTEYMESTSNAGWKTRISSLRLVDTVPMVSFMANVTVTDPGSPVQFTDLSTFGPSSWQWNLPGAVPSFSSDQHPLVSYEDPGYYDVTLTVSNSKGSVHLTRPGYILLSDPVSITYDDFESSGGWVLTDEFEIGPPQGLGGEHGNSDPLTAYEGSGLLGVDLSGQGSYGGDYESSLTDRQCQAVSPAFDCSAYQVVKFSFMRWLNVEQPAYDHAYIDIFDGASWHEIWANTATIADTGFISQEFDISDIAAGNQGVKIRFSIGATDGLWQYSGWNIDSLRVIGYQASSIHHVHWKGLQSDDWNTPGNWSNGKVPGDTTSVSIPALYPGIFAPGTFSQSTNEIREMIVEPGAVFNLDTGNSLIINSGAVTGQDGPGLKDQKVPLSGQEKPE